MHGHNRRKPPAFEVDFNGCWNWANACSDDGYGTIRRDGRNLRAHRYFYERLVGPIPEGLQLDHLCRNRRCVNPAHLEIVTSAENTRRGRRAKLTPQQVAEIRVCGGSARTVALRYGVNKATINHIRGGHTWRGEQVA